MNSRSLYNLFFIAILSAFLTGCGTISTMKSPTGNTPASLSKYNKVCILDFKTIASPSRSNSTLGSLFADKIADEIERRYLFEKVLRTPIQEEALVISGLISRSVDGNPALRFWIGMGAGSSYFDAQVKFKEGVNGKDIAIMIVDKNSWVLGGGLAAGQTVEVFMNEAARKIAQELEKAM